MKNEKTARKPRANATIPGARVAAIRAEMKAEAEANALALRVCASGIPAGRVDGRNVVAADTSRPE